MTEGVKTELNGIANETHARNSTKTSLPAKPLHSTHPTSSEVYQPDLCVVLQTTLQNAPPPVILITSSEAARPRQSMRRGILHVRIHQLPYTTGPSRGRETRGVRDHR
ncbi:hypothetical protein SJAG_06587 [Schizosaccharomyces japonicus yFS275]|uniref:Uncharacterized protein n=1 Tax=Schizosaccharomyces japonicus (strain yFS275 / FY16936) TaxID=402676 RepID=T0T6L0_SCHJY|nr:hypothetical protein SJAG_06587 [Schizosaccharomyces japonicus yFS275]EQC53064.1 hypothetical protein SJAG_06587 [Schizosaccharomyces japonicus yFS275]